MAATKEEFEEFAALVQSCEKEKPAKADLAKLRGALAKHPDLAGHVGDLAYQAKMQILTNAMPKQRGSTVCIEECYDQMRDELGYKNASAIERSLIEHICLCWLRLHVCELLYESNTKAGLSIAQGLYWEKKLSMHQRRYLRAVETLAKVRRLMEPAPNPLTLALIKQQIGR